MPAIADRITELQGKLDGRTNPDGTTKPGYARNVLAIKAEIARLSAEQAALTRTSTNSVDSDAKA